MTTPPFSNFTYDDWKLVLKETDTWNLSKTDVEFSIDPFIRAVTENLKESDSTLKKLDLSITSLDSERVGALAEALKKNTSLQELKLTLRYIEGATLGEALKVNTTLKYLYLYGSPQFAGVQALAEGLKVNSTLESLIMNRCDLTGDAGKMLAEAMRVNSTLRSLYLVDNQIQKVQFLADALKVNNTLEVLSLNCNNIDSDGVQVLAESLEKNSALQDLDLSDNKLDSSGATALGEALKVNSTLQVLNLADNQIGPAGAEDLGKALAENCTLRELCLSMNKIGSTGFQKLCAGLKVNSALQELELGENQIDSMGAQALGETLKENSSVQILHLHRNRISSAGAQALGESLKKNSALRELHLENNQIGFEGAQALAEALKYNYTLQELNLTVNRTGPLGARAFAEALETNSTLQSLILDHNQLSSEGTKALADALKKNSTLRTLSLDSNQIDTQSIISALKINSTLRELKLPRFLDGSPEKSTIQSLLCRQPSSDDLQPPQMIPAATNVLLFKTNYSQNSETDSNTSFKSQQEKKIGALCKNLFSQRQQISDYLDRFDLIQEWTSIRSQKVTPWSEKPFVNACNTMFGFLASLMGVTPEDDGYVDQLKMISAIGPLAEKLTSLLNVVKEFQKWKQEHDMCSQLSSKVKEEHKLLQDMKGKRDISQVHYEYDVSQHKLNAEQQKTKKNELDDLKREVSSLQHSIETSLQKLCEYPNNVHESYLQELEEELTSQSESNVTKKLIHRGKLLLRDYSADYSEHVSLDGNDTVTRALSARNQDEEAQQLAVVLKKLPFNNIKQQNEARNELNLLLTLQNRPYVVELNGAFFQKSQYVTDLILDMPYYPHGNLLHWLKKKDYIVSSEYDGVVIRKEPIGRDKHEIVQMFLQIVEAVGELHSLNIEHRDLKPENILIDRSGSVARVKLIDFGIGKGSMMPFSSTIKTSNGINVHMTVRYAPPERKHFTSNDRNRFIEGSWDMYSLGVILYEMLCDPKDVSRIDKLTENTTPSQVLASKSGMLDEWSFGMVESLLSRDPDARPSASVIQQQMWKHMHDHDSENRNKVKTIKDVAFSALKQSIETVVFGNGRKRFTVRRNHLVEDTLSYFEKLDNREALLQDHYVRYEGENALGSGVLRDLCTETYRALFGPKTVLFEKNGSGEMEYFSPIDGREVQKEMEAFGRFVFYCVARNYTLRLRLSPLVYCTLVEHIPQTVSGWLDLLRPYDSSIRLLEPYLHSSKGSNRETAESLLEEKKKSLQGCSYRMKNIEHFCRGFTSCMLPEEKEKLLHISWRDAQLLCSGREVISPATVLKVMKKSWKADEWKQSPQHKNTAKWFKEWIRKQDSDGLRLFLGFSTGLNTLPMNLSAYKIVVRPRDFYATSSTCTQEIWIGTRYSSREDFFSMMDQVIENCNIDGQRELVEIDWK